MKKSTHILAFLLVLVCCFSLISCDSRNIQNCQSALDALGFSGMPSENDFFALAESFSLDGKTMKELLIYDYDTANGKGKTNSNDTLKMEQETVPDKDEKYRLTYQYFLTYHALDGLTLPEGLTIGDSLATALDKLVGDKNAAREFVGDGEFVYEMILCEKDGATIAYRDTSKDPKHGAHRFIYQIRYTDEIRKMTDEGSVVTKRTLILSFDNDAEGHPLKIIEITLESRHKA